METTDTPARSVDELLDAILEASVPLHRSIAHLDEAGAEYRLADAPGLAWFERDAGDVISHVSSSPSPDVVDALDDLRTRHLALAGVPAGADNSHLLGLLMLCSAVIDAGSGLEVRMREIAARPAEIVAIDEETGRHDPPLEPLDAALRAWTPLEAVQAPEAGVHPAILEMRFRAQRYERYVPM